MDVASSCIGEICRADYCLACGEFTAGAGEETGREIPTILFRLETQPNLRSLLVDFKDNYTEKLRTWFRENPAAIFPPKLLVVIAQPQANDREKISTAETSQGVHYTSVDSAWEVLKFTERGTLSQETVTPVRVVGGRAPPPNMTG